jgi:hypothetical protein
MIPGGRKASDMSVVVVVTVYPIPEHRAEVVAALARLSACIWCHWPDLPVGPDGM